eukprot:5656510-Pyramimonas_sp.AAC.1
MGSVEWIVHIGGTELDMSSAVTLDTAGNPIVVGFFYKHCVFSGTSLPDIERSTDNPSSRDLFTAKVNGTTGKVLWVLTSGKTADPAAFTDITAVATDNAGDVLVTTSFHTSAGKPISCDAGLRFPPLLYSAGEEDLLIMKVAAEDGQVLWCQAYGGESAEVSYALAVDENGDALLCGNFEGVARFSSTAAVQSAGLTD